MRQHGLPAPKVDTSRPHSPARIYDYLLGGKGNYEVDDLAVDELVAAVPEVRIEARVNRAFLERAVRYVVGSGLRQILDIGTGMPHSPNVHEIARQMASVIGVAYDDNDPIMVAHADALLCTSDATSAVLADLRDPHAIVGHPSVPRVIDFNEPVALLLESVLHFLPQTEAPEQVMATLRDVLAASSFLVLSHAMGDFADCTKTQPVYKRATASPSVSRAETERFLSGFELVQPGLVQIPLWRPDTPLPAKADKVGIYGGIARKVS